jgi:hypothetical protein
VIYLGAKTKIPSYQGERTKMGYIPIDKNQEG